MQVEVFRDRQQLLALATDWERLFRGGRCEPSTSLEWTRALLDTHLHAGDRVIVFVLRDADRVFGIVPACIRRDRLFGPIGVFTLSPVSELYNTHSDLLRDSDRADACAALVRALAGLPERWDLFRMSRLLESGPLTRMLPDALASAGLRFRVRREQPSYVLDLAGGYDAYLGARSAKFRNHLRRRSRQLQAAGRVEFRRAGRELGLEDAWRDLLAVEERSWKHAHGTAISAIPAQREFYRRLCESALLRGSLHLTFLYLDGRPIAFNLGLVQDGRYCYLKTSFEEGRRHLNPATVLRAMLIESLIADGLRQVDFAAEPYQWEAQWTDGLRWHCSLLAFNRTPQALMFRGLARVSDLFRPESGDRVRHADPRALRAPGDGD